MRPDVGAAVTRGKGADESPPIRNYKREIDLHSTPPPRKREIAKTPPTRETGETTATAKIKLCHLPITRRPGAYDEGYRSNLRRELP